MATKQQELFLSKNKSISLPSCSAFEPEDRTKKCQSETVFGHRLDLYGDKVIISGQQYYVLSSHCERGHEKEWCILYNTSQLIRHAIPAGMEAI